MDGHIRSLPQRQTLAGFAAEVEGDAGIAIESLDPGATIVVRTCHSEYWLIVLSPAERTVLVRGGAFRDDTAAVVQGATLGGNLVRTGWIGIGLRLELSAATARVITSHVRSIAVIPHS